MYTKREIQGIINRFVRRLRPDRIIVFGSYAKEKQRPESDLDLLIILDTPLPFGARSGLVSPLLSSLLAHVDAHVYTPEEFEDALEDKHSFVATVAHTGYVAYQR